MKEKQPLFWEIKIGNRTAHNRIVLNAMECNDADKEGNPTELTYKRYRKAVKGNAGVIVIEAISVIDESRGRLNQLIGMPANQEGLAKMISELKKVNDKPLLFIQLTHSGELSEPEFSRRVCVKPLPGFGGDLLSEDEVEEIIKKFVLAAKVAHDAGADGIDVKLCHGYLGSQFLRPYNDRKWKYGGPWENRTRFAYEIYERIAREINDPDFVVGSKVSVWEGFPGGCGTVGPDSPVMDLTESLELIRGLEERGGKFILVSSGSPSITLALTQPDRNIPDYAYLHFYFQQMVRKTAKPQTVVIGGAYSVFRNGQNKFLAVNREESSFVYWGNKNIRDGVCDMVAVGRQSLADSLMPAKLEAGRAEEVDWCTCCDNCIEFLIRQQPVGCATYDKEYTKAFKELRKEQGKLAEKHT
ncbi:MAG: 2,4-dienoyl-CoA reductase [Spirochaetes bacterium DG_61]|nr:MAG: 2,4-dienoyl-CoA reductase [Spirochaetes bacterium DG_61]